MLVSPRKQAEKALSIAAQLEAMRQYAEARNWQIAGKFLEPGAGAAAFSLGQLRLVT